MNAPLEESAIRRGRKLALVAFANALTVCVLGISTSLANPVPLLLPQSTAFSILGHSCGGIQEQAYATGFDQMTSYPTGAVYIKTRCSTGGRGGGTITYSAWVSVVWDFAGNVHSSVTLTSPPMVNPVFSATDVYGDQIYNTGTAAYVSVPAPEQPLSVIAFQSGDQFEVEWIPGWVNPAAIASSTLAATPQSSPAPVLTATVSGSATFGFVGPLQPSTTYDITVVNNTIGGSGPPSIPISLTTGPASTVPSAPTGVTAHWTAVGATTATLVASWNAAVPGDSPVDQYEITINGSDGGGTFTHYLSGTTLTDSLVVDFIPDWSIKVRAHNAAGWGPWSATFTLGGL